MKIAYLANSKIPSKSANSIHVMKMCQAFTQIGHEVKLFVPDYSGGNDETDMTNIFEYYGIKTKFEVVYIPYWDVKGRAFWRGINMAKKVKSFKPDFVLGRILTGCFFTAQSGFKTFFETHQPIKNSGKIYKYLFRYAAQKKYFEKLVVITRALKDYFVKENNIEEDSIIIAPDAADQLNEEEKMMKKRLGGDSNFKVGYVGHMYPGKGMKIISQLVRKCPNYDFHLIGGKGEDLMYWKERLNDLNNVYFHGFVPHREAIKYMNSVDVLLAPLQNRVELSGGKANIAEWTSPLKIFEYMSVQKPIISSNLPVLQEVLQHNRNAVLCSPTNIEEWIKALLKLEENKDLRVKISKEAYQDFLKNYTWKTRAQHILSSIC